jgi:hypothetical protein
VKEGRGSGIRQSIFEGGGVDWIPVWVVEEKGKRKVGAIKSGLVNADRRRTNKEVGKRRRISLPEPPTVEMKQHSKNSHDQRPAHSLPNVPRLDALRPTGLPEGELARGLAGAEVRGIGEAVEDLVGWEMAVKKQRRKGSQREGRMGAGKRTEGKGSDGLDCQGRCFEGSDVSCQGCSGERSGVFVLLFTPTHTSRPSKRQPPLSRAVDVTRWGKGKTRDVRAHRDTPLMAYRSPRVRKQRQSPLLGGARSPLEERVWRWGQSPSCRGTSGTQRRRWQRPERNMTEAQ